MFTFIVFARPEDKLLFVELYWERLKKHCRGGIHASR